MMKKRQNKIWGIIRNEAYEDYEEELHNWKVQKNIISRLRNDEADNNAKGKHTLFCPYCEKPVRILYQQSVKFPYIKHKFSSDSKVCISEDINKIKICKDIIRARKYEGRTTGYLHKKVISQIRQIIDLSPDYKLLKSPEGKRLYHKNGSKEYRIPDLLFSYKNIEIVIEVQNSPEWIKIIAERNKFYKENKIHLIWVFTKNSLIKNSVSSIDMSSRQNFNAFSFDDQCYNNSIRNKEINILCHYQIVTVNYYNKKYDKNIKHIKEVIRLSDLKFKDTSMPYFYDYHKNNIICTEEFKQKNNLCREYFKNIEGHHDFNITYYKHMMESAHFSKFKSIPEYISGKPIQRLNNIATCYIAVIYLFSFLRKYDTLNFALSYDKTGKLKEKFANAIIFWKAVKSCDYKAVEMIRTNQRTSPNTINYWKKTLTSEINKSSEIFPDFKIVNIKVLNLITLFERNTLPYVN